jgi:hypothetical protein
LGTGDPNGHGEESGCQAKSKRRNESQIPSTSLPECLERPLHRSVLTNGSLLRFITCTPALMGVNGTACGTGSGSLLRGHGSNVANG